MSLSDKRGLSILPDVLYRPWSLDGDWLEVQEILGERRLLTLALPGDAA
ncbi:hypothetical protein [Paraburkholderia sp. J8-2]|nr:hypothetical protein [Paraburkholderia sp. J8-2]